MTGERLMGAAKPFSREGWTDAAVQAVDRLSEAWPDWTIRWRAAVPFARSAGFWASWNRAPGNEVVMVSWPDEERLVEAMRAEVGRW